MRKQAVLHAGEKHDGKFQTLGGMQSHHLHAVVIGSAWPSPDSRTAWARKDSSGDSSVSASVSGDKFRLVADELRIRSPETEAETELSPLESFLAHAVLESGEGQADPYDDCVQMMTLHSAKGLEFPVVFSPAWRTACFRISARSPIWPASRGAPSRLCRMTRAMRQLYLTYAEQRRLYGVDAMDSLPGSSMSCRPTWSRRFARACKCRGRIHQAQREPGGVPERRHAHGQPGPAFEVRRRSGAQFRGQWTHARIQVNFEGQGTKWLMLSYANLVRVE